MTIDEQIKREIQTMALTDWERFKELYLDMSKLKICKQRKMGKTLQQIANTMSMPRSSVQTICKNCD